MEGPQLEIQWVTQIMDMVRRRWLLITIGATTVDMAWVTAVVWGAEGVMGGGGNGGGGGGVPGGNGGGGGGGGRWGYGAISSSQMEVRLGRLWLPQLCKEPALSPLWGQSCRGRSRADSAFPSPMDPPSSLWVSDSLRFFPPSVRRGY